MPPSTDTKPKILEAAIELFSEKGFHATSMRDIARKTGIQASSIYAHFASKDAILEAILDWYKEQVCQVRVPPEYLDSLLDSMPPKAFLLGGIQRIKSAPASPRIRQVIHILTGEMFRNEMVREFYQTWYLEENQAKVRQVFERMHAKGLLREGSPETLSWLYNAMLHYFYLEYYLTGRDSRDTSNLERQRETQMEAIFDLFLNQEKKPC